MMSVEVETFVTYRRADGKPISGEYAFVTNIEGIEDDLEESDIIEEHWILESSRTIPQVDPWAEYEVWEEDDDDEPKVKRFRQGERRQRQVNYRRMQ